MTRNRYSHLDIHYGKIVYRNWKWRMRCESSSLWYNISQMQESNSVQFVGTTPIIFMITFIMCSFSKHITNKRKLVYANHLSKFLGVVSILSYMQPVCLTFLAFGLGNIVLLKVQYTRNAKVSSSVRKGREMKYRAATSTIEPSENIYTISPLICDVSLSLRRDLKMLLIIAGDIELNPGPSQKEIDEALRKYLKDLAGVKDKWFMIGSSLKIPISELHSFEAEFMQDSDRSLQEVIAYWVHNFDGAGKSQSLCEALKNVNESRLAVRLRRKYGLIVSSDSTVGRSDSESLSESIEQDTIKKVVLDLKSINWKWYSFGSELQMSCGELKSLEAKYASDLNRLLLEVINHWLRNYEADDYIKPISDALVAMEEESLAFCVRSKYGKTLKEASPASIRKKPQKVLPENIKKISHKGKDVWSFLPALTYPGLELDDSLSDSQKKNFEIKLEKQSEEMIYKFGRILTKFNKFLKVNNVDIDDLKLALQIRTGISAMSKDEIERPTIKKDLMKANNIAKLMLIVSNYCSFFNYTLLYDLFEHVDYEEGKYFLDEYKLDFKRYAEQRVIYCPYGIKSESSETAKVIFSLDEKFKDCKIIHISRLQDDLGNIFHLDITSIFVSGVKPGSVSITFLLPLRFQERFTSFSSKQIQQLKELKYEESGILTINCGETKQIIHEPKPESDIGSDSGYGISITTSMTIDAKNLGSRLHFIESVTLREWTQKSDITETASLIENYDNPDSYPSFLTLAESAIQLQSPIHEMAQKGDLEGIKNMSNSYNPMDFDDKGNTALHYAAANGHIEVLKYLVEDLEINPAITGHNNKLTPLHICCYHGHLLLVKYLLDECKLDPSCYDEQQLTPLHYACSSGQTDIVNHIVNYVSTQNLGQLKDFLDDYECGCTPLMVASSSGYLYLVQYLISLSCDESATDLDNNTLLHRAALNGHLSVVKYLTMERQFSVNGKSQNGMTPLHYASMNGHLDIVDFLITTSGCDPTQLVDRNGCNPLHLAALSNHIDIVQFLIDDKGMNPSSPSAQTLNTPLHFSCIKGHLSIVQYLTIKKGCDPNMANKFGMTPLFAAAKNGCLEVLKFLILVCQCSADSVDYSGSGMQLVHVAASQGNLDLLAYLIEEKNCNPSSLAVDKITPLHIAVTNGHLNIVKYLVQAKGCDVKAKIDNSEDTPLFIAAVYGHEDIIRFFMEEVMLDKDTLFKDDYHLLHVVATKGYLSILKYLILNLKCNSSVKTLSAGYSSLHFAALRGNLEIIKFFIETLQCDPLCISNDKDTLLHAACIGGNLNVVQYLTKALGTTPNIGNVSGMTPFHYAVYNGFHDIVIYLLNEAKADINATDNFDRTVLHFATGHLNIFKYLVEIQGCSTDKYDKDHKTSIHIAAIEGHLEVLKYFVELNTSEILKSESLKTPEFSLFSWENVLTNGSRNALQLTTLNGHINIVRYLVEEKNWSVNVKDNTGNFLLHLAAGTGHLAIVKYLVSNISYDHFWEKNGDGNIPLQVAVIFNYFHVFKYLISAMPWTPEYLRIFGSATLLIAVFHDRLKFVRHLVENFKCDPSWPVPDIGDAPIHTAARKGRLSIIKYFILEGNTDPGCKNLINAMPLHLAVQEGFLNIVEVILSSDKGKLCLQARLNIDGLTPIHLAAMKGHLNILKHLVDIEGCDPSIVDDKGNTALHYAALNGYLPMVKVLIHEYKCNPICRDILGITPLHLAAQQGFVDIITFLTADVKCDPLPVACDGQTPITAAALSGQIPVLLYYIVNLKCSPYIQDSTDGTPLHYAALSGQIETMNFLLSIFKPDEVVLRDNEGCHPIHYASYGGQINSVVFLLQLGVSPDIRDRFGKSCLHYAAQGGHLPLVQAFVEQIHFDPTLQSYDGVSPLHVAAWQGHLQVVYYLTKICNCSPLTEDSAGDTPLHWAASEGQLEVVKFFVNEFEVSPDTQGSEGHLLDYAVFYGHSELAAYLTSKSNI